MYAGVALSAAGHAAVVALAVWGLPWLRVRPEPPVSAVMVSLVGEAQFATLSRGDPRPPAPEAPPAPVEPRVTVPEPAPVPETDAELMPEPDLAPFDPASPLGLPTLRADAPLPTAPERIEMPPPRPAASRPARPPASTAARPGDAGAAPRTAGEAAARMASFEAAVREAIAAAQVYPAVARDRGISGTTRLHVSVGRDGRLLNARILRSSGAQVLDRAGLDAAQRARLPAAPPELGGARFSFEVGVAFTLTGG